MNLAYALAHHADRYPEKTALSGAGGAVSWSRLLENVELLAGGLKGRGVGRGGVVAVLLHNDRVFLELMYACASLGAVFMPLNWRLAGPELNYIINHAEAQLLITESEFADSVEQAAPLCCREVVGVDEAGDWVGLSEVLGEAEPHSAPVDVGGDDLARLMYTSGTTSRPKGVELTFGNLEAKNLAHLVEFGITPEARALVCGPLYHVGALDMITTTVLQAGGGVHLLRRFDPGATIEAIAEIGITHTWMAPVMIGEVLAHPTLGDRDLSTVQLINGGGEKMPLPLIGRLRDAFPAAWFADAYGMTETASGDTFLDPDHLTAKLGSVGKPVFNCRLRIVDGSGAEAGPGVEGEIQMRGPKVCRGYLKDPEATAAAFVDGWLRTGDVGYLDEDGYLFIVDRVKDMIISGGENVASSEVERVLYEHAAVVEAAVVGRDDPRWGQVPVAFLVVGEEQPEPEELTGFCRDRLSGFKTPKEFYFVDSLPRNPSGKVLKRELRILAAAEKESGHGR